MLTNLILMISKYSRLASVFASAKTCSMFSSVKSSGGNEAETVAVDDLRLSVLMRIFVVVAPFLKFNGDGAVNRLDDR